MAKRNYKVGQNRCQMAILPPSIDDYVSENNPVRAIDAYVETLNGMDLNLKNSDTGLTAEQPAFHPSILKSFTFTDT